ncbi:hypothetical protein DSTSK_08510 [Desulforhabdus sp. TSK]|nr:hypothetical protein DSTSK_08510 [Desulforhabdus sp. TSK]
MYGTDRVVNFMYLCHYVVNQEIPDKNLPVFMTIEIALL